MKTRFINTKIFVTYQCRAFLYKFCKPGAVSCTMNSTEFLKAVLVL